MRKYTTLVKRFSRRIAVISDLHIGSKYVIFPENFSDRDGNQINLNDGQKMIMKHWKDFSNVCDDMEIDTVFVTGDVVHGQNYKERGLGLLTPSLDIQETAAIDLLRPFLKNRKSFWVAGTGYHNSTPGHSTERDICNAFSTEDPRGRKDFSKVKGSVWLGMVANLQVGNKVINISHGGSGAFIYRETAMGREITFSKVAYANKKLPKIDMFIHGHWHWFCHLHESEVHHVQLPAWTAYEPVGIYLKNYVRFQPDMGGVLVLIDEFERIAVWHFLYEVPHIADALVKV